MPREFIGYTVPQASPLVLDQLGSECAESVTGLGWVNFEFGYLRLGNAYATELLTELLLHEAVEVLP